MKIELTKKIDYSGTWYFVYCDNTCVNAFRQLEQAEAKYEELKANGLNPPVTEILKSEEINAI